MTDPTLREAVRRVAVQVRAAGGRALLVGGGVRDALLGIAPKDWDIEVFGLPLERLEALVGALYPLVLVGRSFGVLKLRDLPLDLSLPRRESKTGPGHKGFAILGEPHLSHGEAAARRDFTINAISWDPLDGEWIDPFDGRSDLAAGRLRHVSGHFGEDPLRVLRGMQLIARFELSAEPSTVELCRTIEPENLPAERLLEEWRKLLVKGRKPSLGLEFLRACGWVCHYPELAALIGCPQDPLWHPEGDVWVHTLHCLDAFARERTGPEWDDLVVGLAILCHDFGKPATTVTDTDGRIRSPAHEAVGVEPTRRFLERLTRETAVREMVEALVLHHMRPAHYFKSQAGDGAVRRLARGVGRIDLLARVVSADMQGSPPKVRDREAVAWLLDRAAALAVRDSAPKPIVLGRHFLSLGLTPGPHLKPLLHRCFEAQLDGAFTDEAGGLEFARQLLSRSPPGGAT